MCRLLAVVSSEPVAFRFSLQEAPRSLAYLSQEHADGWGVAVFDETAGWSIEKGAVPAHRDRHFDEVAAGSRGVVLLAHVRRRTVGPQTLANTHPFRRGRWVFAHNGTVPAVDWLHARTSPARRAEVEGDTDSERIFAYLLTHLDRADADAAMLGAVGELGRAPELGSCTFLLGDGDALWVHRSGRTLYWLERRPGDAVLTRRESSETGAVVETPWSPARSAILVASEKITDEPWRELGEGSLVRIDRSAHPSLTVVIDRQ